jgi:hypothetical protein
MTHRLLLAFVFLQTPSLRAAAVVIDTFTGSYLNRGIAYDGGTLTISVTNDVDDSFLGVVTGNAAAAAFHKSAILLADSDSGVTDFRLAFSTPVSNLAITFTDVDADATPTLANLTPTDLLAALEFAGNARAIASGSNGPTVPSGSGPPTLTVLAKLVKAADTGTSAIARFEFLSPQTSVRISYQNGAGGGGTGGVGVTEIRFDSIPELDSTTLLALSAFALLRRRR